MSSTERELVTEDSDADLLNSSLNDAPQLETSEPLVEEPQGQLRDENGRFAAKATDEPVEETAPTAPAQEGPGKQVGNVPAFRLKEEADGRRAEKERADRLEQMLTQLLAKQTAPSTPTQPEQPAPEFWEDPNAFVDSRLSSVNQQVGRVVETYSRRFAEQVHGAEKVQEAYQALDAAIRSGAVDGAAVKSQLSQSMDPFGDVMNWFQGQTVQREVGNDLSAYKKRVLEEAMTNPEFVAQVIAAQRQQAGQGQPQRVGNITRMPPSLTRAAGTTASDPADQYDDSDQGLLRSALKG